LTGKSFGKFLDAGTGLHSLRWMASLIEDVGRPAPPQHHENDARLDDDPANRIMSSSSCLKIEEYTAITADEGMRQTVLKEAQELGIEEYGRILIGNWQTTTTVDAEQELCHGEMYDTILADYLVGAMDGFSPYYQDEIFPRLNQHLKPGGRLYVIGLNPIPHRDDTNDVNANIICKVARVRDACILLAGHRCYREYPVEWIERHLEKVPGLKVVQSSRFPIMYSHAAIVRQLNVARSKLSLFPSRALAKEMEGVIDDLERESREATARSPNGRIRFGFDYVVTAEKSLEGGEC
jgi:hypothetical protein